MSKMVSKMWLLVEWLKENTMIPSYGVVVVKSSEYDLSELLPGSEISIKLKRNKIRQAKIIRVSENKRYLNDQKDLLENQNEKMKAMVNLCLQSFREANNASNMGRMDANFSGNRRNTFRPVVKASPSDSSSDSEPQLRKKNSFRSRAFKPLLTMASAIQTISSGGSDSEPEVTNEAHHSRDRQAKPMVRAGRAGSSSNSEREVRKDAHHSRDRKTNTKQTQTQSTPAGTSSDSERELNVYNQNSNSLPNNSLQSGNLQTDRVNRCYSWVTSTPIAIENGQSDIINQSHQETQTEDVFFEPHPDKLNFLVEGMYSIYGKFVEFCETLNIDFEELQMDDDLDETSSSDFDHHEYDYKTEPSTSSSRRETNSDRDEVVSLRNVTNTEEDSSSESDRPLYELRSRMDRPRSPKVRRMAEQANNDNVRNARSRSNDKDMTPIGNGYAKVPTRLLHDIDWSSYTTATRHLLQAIFPRSVLATHCLTGKQSPAFMNRPPKKVLDRKLVEDIVKIVSTRCNVPKNLVRNTITIKCADEAKLYRNRQYFKQLQRKGNLLNNDENMPPPASDNNQ